VAGHRYRDRDVRMMSVSMRFAGARRPEGLDLSGSWVARNFNRRPGESARYGNRRPSIFWDSLSEAGRAAAMSTSPSQISMPERMCDFYPPTYIVLGPRV
jgi:hypothetical protein